MVTVATGLIDPLGFWNGFFDAVLVTWNVIVNPDGTTSYEYNGIDQNDDFTGDNIRAEVFVEDNCGGDATYDEGDDVEDGTCNEECDENGDCTYHKFEGQVVNPSDGISYFLYTMYADGDDTCTGPSMWSSE